MHGGHAHTTHTNTYAHTHNTHKTHTHTCTVAHASTHSRTHAHTHTPCSYDRHFTISIKHSVSILLHVCTQILIGQGLMQDTNVASHTLGWWTCGCTHAHTCTHMHTHTHNTHTTHTHACTHKRMHTHTHTHAHTQHTHTTHTHAHIHACAHTHTHTRMNTHACTHTHAHTCTHACTHACMHARPHTLCSYDRHFTISIKHSVSNLLHVCTQTLIGQGLMQDTNVERWQSKVHSRREGASPQIIFKTEILSLMTMESQNQFHSSAKII